jgi:hypothetical protein
MKSPSLLAPLLGFAAISSAQVAQAQQPCVASADLGDAVIYAMPIAYEAVQDTCASLLPADGFLATEGEAFVDKFRDRRDAAWPGAFRLLRVFLAEQAEQDVSAPDIIGLISALPEQDLRPFIDAIIAQLLGEEIKPESCVEIERGVELLSPLPAGNVAGLIAFIAELSELKDPEICRVPASEQAAP